ncbi:uncharacterized protein F4822DRAFT_391562, partial [Hypoxylon trugodes]|uniref:uncharacterized protein n=1 Tax=Hypoxylon trugodes TaxID=326681 RepID=UPI00219C3908
MAASPTTVLFRIAPLLSSTAAVSMTLCEDVFFRPLGTPHSTVRPQANRILATNFKSCAPYAMSMTATYYFSAIGVAIANVTLRGGVLALSGSSAAVPQRLAAGFYIAGAIFNALHFAFAPSDISLMDIIMDQSKADSDKGKDNCTAMADWVKLNVWRGFLADFPGFVCNLIGFTLSL